MNSSIRVIFHYLFNTTVEKELDNGINKCIKHFAAYCSVFNIFLINISCSHIVKSSGGHLQRDGTFPCIDDNGFWVEIDSALKKKQHFLSMNHVEAYFAFHLKFIVYHLILCLFHNKFVSYEINSSVFFHT